MSPSGIRMATRQIVKGDFIGLPSWPSSLTNTGTIAPLQRGSSLSCGLHTPSGVIQRWSGASNMPHVVYLFEVNIPAQSPWNRDDDKPLRHDTGCRGMAASRAGRYIPLKPTKHERPPA
jgi:hypothetical protein